MMDKAFIFCIEEQDINYLKDSYVPELKAYLLKSADCIKGFYLNTVKFECNQPTLTISEKSDDKLINIKISAKGDYSAHININLKLYQVPLHIDITSDKDEKYLIINTNGRPN